jgi:hypothetical protein
MSPDQIVAQVPDIAEAIGYLNKSLRILDMAGFSIAAIHVDSAIANLHGELAQLPQTETKMGTSHGIDFSSLDEMCVMLFGSSQPKAEKSRSAL